MWGDDTTGVPGTPSRLRNFCGNNSIFHYVQLWKNYSSKIIASSWIYEKRRSRDVEWRGAVQHCVAKANLLPLCSKIMRLHSVIRYISNPKEEHGRSTWIVSHGHYKAPPCYHFNLNRVFYNSNRARKPVIIVACPVVTLWRAGSCSLRKSTKFRVEKGWLGAVGAERFTAVDLFHIVFPYRCRIWVTETIKRTTRASWALTVPVVLRVFIIRMGSWQGQSSPLKNYFNGRASFQDTILEWSNKRWRKVSHLLVPTH